MSNESWFAYVVCFPGSGRPNYPACKPSNGRSFEDRCPMECHNGVAYVGEFPNFEMAEAMAHNYWNDFTYTDDNGYVQWK